VKRIGGDTLSTILLASRQTAREEYRDAVAADFVAYESSGAGGRSGGGVMSKENVIRYIADAFPGMFSRDFAEQLFNLGAVTPPRSDRREDTSVGAADEADGEGKGFSGSVGTHSGESSSAGWNLRQFISHIMALSENTLL
jgi:hypothetical protein